MDAGCLSLAALVNTPEPSGSRECLRGMNAVDGGVCSGVYGGHVGSSGCGEFNVCGTQQEWKDQMRGHYSKLPKRIKLLEEAMELALEGLKLNAPGYAFEVEKILSRKPVKAEVGA